MQLFIYVPKTDLGNLYDLISDKLGRDESNIQFYYEQQVNHCVQVLIDYQDLLKVIEFNSMDDDRA